MNKIKEVLKLNWYGEGIFPEISEIKPLVRYLIVYPIIIVQTPFAMLYFLFKEKPNG